MAELLEAAQTVDKRSAVPKMNFSTHTTQLSIRQAAAVLDVSERSIRRAINRGDLSASKVGGAFQIGKDERKPADRKLFPRRKGFGGK